MTTRHADTTIRRSADGRHVLKTATTPESRCLLLDERDRLCWLHGTGMETAEVVDWREDGHAWTMVTTAVPGIPASRVPADRADRATSSMAMYLTELHALATDGCPFDRSLEIVVPEAAHRATDGRIDRRTGELLEEVNDGALRAAVEENLDLVVCHGDFCLGNVLVDDQTYDVTGVVDVGRLGLADCHADLALLTRSMAAPDMSPRYGPATVRQLLATYPIEVDPWRLDYYRLLDELF